MCDSLGSDLKNDPTPYSGAYEQYNHHGREVWVKKDLKGKHREHCLCFDCQTFQPDDRKKNCQIANLLYTICVLQDLVTPVWECPHFKPIIGR